MWKMMNGNFGTNTERLYVPYDRKQTTRQLGVNVSGSQSMCPGCKECDAARERL